jgi:propanol-preferring alcohol dehydrogenase
MKAAVLHEFKSPLELEDVSPPILKQDDVLLQVEACGVCHSDVHLADGDWPQLAAATKFPLILGHEIAGRVVERGEAVQGLAIGERVGVPWLHWTCGECEFCREGNENLCVRQKITGVTVNGGFAALVSAPASHVVKIPDGLPAMAAAPLFCAGVTVYRALRQARIVSGQRLAVFGIGGLGHLAVQMGKELGARVIAIDVSEAKLNLAKSLGAEQGLDASSVHVTKELRARGGVHVALVTSAARAAYESAFSCLRPTGTLLLVGLPAENICFPPILMAAGEICIRASAVGTRQDLREVLALAAAGRIRCETTTHSLGEVNSVLDRLRRGEISGRAVLTTNSPPL